MAYGVGAALRHERARRELTLAQISGQTRISERFLTAIENERFEQLPGILFTRNFVRQYALALQIDPDPLLAQLPRIASTETALPLAPSRGQRSAWDPRWNSLFASMAWLVLAASAALLAWLHFNHPARTHAETAAPVKQSLPRPQEMPLPAVPLVVAQPAAVQPAAQPVIAPAQAASARPVEAIITAKQAAWVQVTADGKVAFAATLQPDESRTVSADDQIKVTTGNAGGIVITLNGKVIDSLGPSGQVRVVRLTAAGPQFLPKIPAPPPDPL